MRQMIIISLMFVLVVLVVVGIFILSSNNDFRKEDLNNDVEQINQSIEISKDRDSRIYGQDNTNIDFNGNVDSGDIKTEFINFKDVYNTGEKFSGKYKISNKGKERGVYVLIRDYKEDFREDKGGRRSISMAIKSGETNLSLYAFFHGRRSQEYSKYTINYIDQTPYFYEPGVYVYDIYLRFDNSSVRASKRITVVGDILELK